MRMRRFIFTMFLLLCFGGLSGCDFPITLNPQTDQVLVQSAARVVGYKVAQNNKEVCATALPYAKTLLAETDQDKLVNTMIPAAIALLSTSMKDPLFVASLNDAVKLLNFNVDNSATIEEKAALVYAALNGFIEGMKMATTQ